MTTAAVPSFALPLYGSTLLSILSDLVPANMRGIAVALYAFCGTMIGATLGPLMVTLLTEHVLAVRAQSEHRLYSWPARRSSGRACCP